MMNNPGDDDDIFKVLIHAHQMILSVWRLYSVINKSKTKEIKEQVRMKRRYKILWGWLEWIVWA